MESWTAKKGINIFEKKFIFVPVNKSLHWSLCVVVNPGANDPDCDLSTDEECPCMLFLDSLKAHRKNEVANKIRLWLNSEWKRLNKGDTNRFTDRNMPVYDPRGMSLSSFIRLCLVFLLYSRARGFFVSSIPGQLLGLRRFRLSLCFCHVPTEAHVREMKEEGAAIVTESKEFQFDMDDIHRIRNELRTLLERLSVFYTAWKADERRKQVAAKLAARSQQTQIGGSDDKNDKEAQESSNPIAQKDEDRSTLDAPQDMIKEDVTPDDKMDWDSDEIFV